MWISRLKYFALFGVIFIPIFLYEFFFGGNAFPSMGLERWQASMLSAFITVAVLRVLFGLTFKNKTFMAITSKVLVDLFPGQYQHSSLSLENNRDGLMSIIKDLEAGDKASILLQFSNRVLFSITEYPDSIIDIKFTNSGINLKNYAKFIHPSKNHKLIADNELNTLLNL